MKAWSKYPVIFEINTWVWLGELSRKYGRNMDLGTVPKPDWDAVASLGLPWDELRGKMWRLKDVLSGESYDRSGSEMRDGGLYVDLGPWKCHLFQAHAL